METLKEGGVNSVFLGDLLSAGPSSLSFAESIAGLGKDGISFINESMQEIADMTNQFGLGYAQDAVGTVQGNVNNVSIRIDSVELTWDAASANLTLDDVNTAVNEALQDVVDEILAGVS
ncbi:MAG: hypothetical protein GTO63_37000 [Anaerolineae bacterium]|nr:hypothetical protein [Anaerolineae bacterium]NIO00360.1 hypothetical protein [Anaerolineae bacterium]